MNTTTLALVILLVVLVILLLFVVAGNDFTKSLSTGIQNVDLAIADLQPTGTAIESFHDTGVTARQPFDSSISRTKRLFDTTNPRAHSLKLDNLPTKQSKMRIRRPRYVASKARDLNENALNYTTNRFPVDLYPPITRRTIEFEKERPPQGLHGRRPLPAIKRPIVNEIEFV